MNKKKTQRHHELVYKLEFESITDAEHAEFMRLANQAEKLCNLRVKYLIELAQLRAVTLPQLMIDWGLKKFKSNINLRKLLKMVSLHPLDFTK